MHDPVVLCPPGMSWGLHSGGQAITGATIGVILYYTSTRLPQTHVIVETAVIVPAGFVLLMSDPAREEWAAPGVKSPGGNFNNILAWYVWGCAMQLMSCVLLTRHYMALGIFSRMQQSLRTALRPHAVKHAVPWDADGLQQTLIRDPSGETSASMLHISNIQSDLSHMTEPAPHYSEAGSGPIPESVTDCGFTWGTGFAMLLVMMLSSAIQHYSVVSSWGLCSREIPPSWCH